MFNYYLNIYRRKLDAGIFKSIKEAKKDAENLWRVRRNLQMPSTSSAPLPPLSRATLPPPLSPSTLPPPLSPSTPPPPLSPYTPLQPISLSSLPSSLSIAIPSLPIPLPISTSTPTSPKVYSENDVINMLRHREDVMRHPCINYGPYIDGIIEDMSNHNY